MPHRIDRIGKYEIMGSLGEGGMGEVFLARDTIIGREVAIKVINRAALPAPDGEGRFYREIQAASRLSHPNLVTIHEFGDKSGTLFQVMDFVAGEDLGAMLRSHALAPKEALELLAQVCDGLAHAHQHGIMHRNLKPSNIRVGRVSGRPTAKILDFGMTRVARSESAIHMATLGYTAPEAFQAAKTDGRADLYAVGVMLYEAFTGHRPFTGETPAALAQQVLQEDPPPLDPEHIPGISPAVEQILRQALAKDPTKRFANAEAMAAALRAARNPAWTPAAAPEWTLPVLPAAAPASAGQSRSRAALAWASGLAAVIVLGAAGGLWLRARRRHAPPTPAGPVVVASPLQAPPAPAAPPPVATPAPAAPMAATPVPAPAPPAPVRQPNAAPDSRYADLAAATAAVDQDPQGVLAAVEPIVAEQPGNETATALRLVALYNLGRYAACSKAIHEANAAGHALWPLALKQPALRRMLEKDAKDPHLPRRKPAAPAPEP